MTHLEAVFRKCGDSREGGREEKARTDCSLPALRQGSAEPRVAAEGRHTPGNIYLTVGEPHVL